MATLAVVDVVKPEMKPFSSPASFIVDYIGELISSGIGIQLCDMKISFLGREDAEAIPVHKSIMATTIPFFQHMAHFLEQTDAENSCIELDPSIVSPESFRVILDYLSARQLHVPSLKKADLLRACEFLLIDSLPKSLDDNRSEPTPYVTARASEFPQTCSRSFADLKDAGMFCDLTVRFYGADPTVQSPTFLLHKCLLVGAFANLPILFPNICDASEVQLSTTDVQPALFEKLIRHVYGIQEIEVSEIDQVFHLFQASVYLGCHDLLAYCGGTLKYSVFTSYTWDDYMKLWKYARYLESGNAGWKFPTVFCVALFTTMMGHPNYGWSDTDLINSTAVKSLSLSEMKDILSCYQDGSRLQGHLMLTIDSWLHHSWTERSVHQDALFSLIDWDAINFDDMKCVITKWRLKEMPFLKAKITKLQPWKSSVVEEFRCSGLNVSVKDKYLDHRSFSRFLGLNCCIADKNWRLLGFTQKGELQFENSAIFEYRRYSLLKMVSISDRVFLICRQRDQNSEHGDHLRAWELHDGQIGKRFRLQWLLSELPSWQNLRVFADERFLYVVELKTDTTWQSKVYSCQCCAYHLFSPISMGDKEREVIITFAHSFESPKLPIPRTRKLDTPTPFFTTSNGTLFFFFPEKASFRNACELIQYSLNTYDVNDERKWIAKPSMPFANPHTMQLVSHRGSVYVGFVAEFISDFELSLSDVLRNGPQFKILQLGHGWSEWRPLTTPGMLGGKPESCSFYLAGHRLFVSGYEQWGAPRLTRSLNLDTDDSGESQGSSLAWETIPDLRGYQHPEHFASFCAPSPSSSAANGQENMASEGPHPDGGPTKPVKIIKAVGHPTYPAMVLQAVIALAEKDGSPLLAIVDYLEANWVLALDRRLVSTYANRALARHVDSGVLQTTIKAGVCHFKAERPCQQQATRGKRRKTKNS